MEDPNGQAVANAIAAGQNFWGNVQRLKQNQFQKQQLGLESKRTDIEQQKADMDKQLAQSNIDTAAISRKLIEQQVSKAALDTTQAQKADFLQSHDPLPHATAAFGQSYADQNAPTPSEYTDDDVAAANARMYGDAETTKRINGYTPTAPKGYVKFQLPDDEEGRKVFNFNINGAPAGQQWAMPTDQFQAANEQYKKLLSSRSSSEFQKPFDQLSSDAKQAIIESYQKNAPPGVKVSPAEAISAYRSGQLRSGPLPDINKMGLIPSGGEFDPMNPQSLKLNLTAPIGGPGGNSGLTPQQYNDFGKPLQDLMSKNQEYQLYNQKAVHTKDVVSYAEDSHPTVSSDKSLIMSYLKTIDPTVRVSEGTVTTVMDGMGLPDEIKNKINKVMTGALFTPEHREWFKTAALQNLANAKESAVNSLNSNLSIAGATGNPLAAHLNVNHLITPPGEGSSGSKLSGGTKRFSSIEQANSAKLPPGTVVEIFDPGSGKYRRAINQ